MTQSIKAVYFLHNSSGKLLYIGKTNNLLSRIRYHIEDKLEGTEWKVDIDRGNIQYIELESELDVEIYETYYISLFKPPYNNSKLYCTKNSQLVLPDILQYKKTLPFFNCRSALRQVVKDKGGSTVFKDVVELYDAGDITVDQLQVYAPDIRDAYNLLGVKKMKALGLNPTRIKQALADARPEIQQDLQQAVYVEFQLNSFYTLKDIKNKLQGIYDSLGMFKKAKATDLNQWFTTTNKNVKNTNGLYITT
jgi:hypothetical protein